jgi:hypothetical protein
MGHYNACFVHQKKALSIFFSCPISRYIWSFFQCAFDSPAQPRNCVWLGMWVNRFTGTEKNSVKIFLVAIFWSIWETWNRACFDNILPHDPCEIQFQICHWSNYWGELQKSKVQEMLHQRINLLTSRLSMLARPSTTARSSTHNPCFHVV